jgi:hypothetical protein
MHFALKNLIAVGLGVSLCGGATVLLNVASRVVGNPHFMPWLTNGLLGPVNWLCELDRQQQWGLLWENPLAYLVALVFYWVVLSEIVFLAWAGFDWLYRYLTAEDSNGTT